MKKRAFLFFYVLFASSCFGQCDDVSLESIVASVEQHGVEKALSFIEENKCFDKKNRKIILSNNVKILPDKNLKKIEWQVSKLSKDSKEFSLDLPIGDYRFMSPFSDSTKFKILACSYNMVSSGTNIIAFQNNTFVLVESWSCGSLGCSYNYVYSNNVSVDNTHFCH